MPVFEVPVGIEPTIRVLQTHALPLGHGTATRSQLTIFINKFQDPELPHIPQRIHAHAINLNFKM